MVSVLWLHTFIFTHFSLCLSEHFCRVTSVELLLKVHLIPKSSSCSSSSSSHMKTKAAVGNKGGQVEIDTRPQTAVERLAYRFNQVRYPFYRFSAVDYRHGDVCVARLVTGWRPPFCHLKIWISE